MKFGAGFLSINTVYLILIRRDIFLWRTPLLDYLIDLQKGCISLMQNRNLTLDRRLILMGNFLKEVEELAAEGREDEICLDRKLYI